MKNYNFKWVVQIPTGLFMPGVHRFKTKRKAQDFLDKWLKTQGNNPSTYDEIPIVRKDKL